MESPSEAGETPALRNRNTSDREHIMYTRREFLRDLGRGALAFGVGGGLAALILRDGSRCTKAALCGDCAEFGRCSKPQAAAARQTLQKDDSNG